MLVPFPRECRERKVSIPRGSAAELTPFIDIKSRFLREDNLDDLMSMGGMHLSREGPELIYRSISHYLLFQVIQLKKALNPLAL